MLSAEAIDPARARASLDRGAMLTHLERARAAPTLDARLAALIDAWRVCKLPELAVVIEQLGQRLLERRPIIRRGERGEQALWRAAERGDPLAVGQVIVDLFHDKLGHYESSTVARVAALPPDPRVAMRLWKWTHSRVNDDDRDIVYPALAAIGDPRTVELLREDLPAAATRTANEIAAAGPPRADRASRAVIAELARGDPTERALLREVYARPRSDEPRLIYADYLISQDDPRGELIALQCRSKLNAAGQRRLQHLLDRFAPRWVGPLEPYLVTPKRGKRELRRGFLARCRINGARPESEHYPEARERRAVLLAELATHRAWATLEEVEFPRYSMKWHAPLLAHLEKLRVAVKLV